MAKQFQIMRPKNALKPVTFQTSNVLIFFQKLYQNCQVASIVLYHVVTPASVKLREFRGLAPKATLWFSTASLQRQ